MKQYEDDHVPLDEYHPLAAMLREMIDGLFEADVVVQFIPFARRGEGGEFFTPDRNPNYLYPVIRVHREHAMQPGPPIDELVILAHEAGHFDSYRAAHHTDDYARAVDAFKGHLATFGQANRSALDPELVAIVFAEERRAWKFARARLEALGFTHWPSFEEHEARGLGFYVERFKA